MNENENNFEPLRRLLAFKNLETPPPGYFNNFSAQVVARIRAGEANALSSASERLFSESPWLMKFLQIFQAKPAFAGAFAMALCLVLVFGIVSAERPEASAPQPFLQTAETTSMPVADISPVAFVAQQPSGQITLAADNTNPMTSLQPVASLFGRQDAFAQQASFTIPGN
ncbi:MAG TPA: hypothetical protein VHX90_05990 [Verrucomicrobiae bacterium]|nr:hypothetical protein [Verrucomicrobiae bacterium]